MFEAEFPRVQHLARGGDARECFEARVLFAAIHGIADERVADVLEMHANLVRAPGVQKAFDQGRGVEAFDDFEAGPGVAGVGAFGGGHPFAMRGVPRDADLDFALFVREFAADDRAINLGDAAFLELRGEGKVGFVGFGHDDATAGVHVETMHDARARDAADAAELALAMIEQAVH